jgi:hypothetical protein
MRTAAFALLASLASLGGCQQRQTQIRLKFDVPDAGACADQTNIKCANYIEFSAGDEHGFRSQCTRIDITLVSLCDVGRLAEGQELFQLSPDTQLPIRLEGKRVFPATGCNSGVCPPRTIFSGETAEAGPIGNYAGQVLEIPVTVHQPCGMPEAFFFLPEGSTCEQLCGVGQVACANVEGGCLCEGLPTPADIASRQGGIDSGQ